jgi:hypothetical protein
VMLEHEAQSLDGPAPEPTEAASST